MEKATSALKHKLAELMTQEDMLHATAEQLALKGAALERQAENDRVSVLAAAEREVTDLRAQVEGSRAQLREAVEQSSSLKQRAEELGDRQARAEAEAGVWKEAHASLSVRAMHLESDKGKISAALESERARAATLTEAQNRLQRRRQEEKDGAQRAAAAAAAEAAELPNRLERIRREAQVPLVSVAISSVPPPYSPVGASLGLDMPPAELGDEVAAVQRKLREHSSELQAEARELEEFRELLASRDELRREAQGATAHASRTKAKAAQVQAQVQRAREGGGGGGGGGGVGEGSAAARAGQRGYSLRSMVEGLHDEESWWERYSRDVLHGAAGSALVAELE